MAAHTAKENFGFQDEQVDCVWIYILYLIKKTIFLKFNDAG